MKLKLVEAAQPINKLENNIARNILPAFKKYGLDFTNSPLEINKFIYVYKSITPKYFASLRLNTASNEIERWNEENSNEYVGDLFAELIINGKSLDLGVLSSRNPESVDIAMIEFNLDNYKQASPDEIANNKLIPPKRNDGKYGPMTKEEWQKEYQRLNAATDKLRDELRSMENRVLAEELKTNTEYQRIKADLENDKDDYFKDEKLRTIEQKIINEELGSNDEYNAIKEDLKNQSDYINNVFLQKIYPFDYIG